MKIVENIKCPENDHFLNTQILKKYNSFYVLLFDSGPIGLLYDIMSKFRKWFLI